MLSMDQKTELAELFEQVRSASDRIAQVVRMTNNMSARNSAATLQYHIHSDTLRIRELLDIDYELTGGDNGSTTTPGDQRPRRDSQ